MRAERKTTLRDLILLAIYGALMMAAQVLMAPLPNIEPVTTMLICCTIVYGRRAFYAAFVFVLLEGLVYGLHIWFLSYLYIWPLLVLLVLLLRGNESNVFWTIISAAFGLFFGALCAIPYFFIGGWAMGFLYWVSGIPFDIMHCLGNAAMSGALLRPLTGVMKRLEKVNF